MIQNALQVPDRFLAFAFGAGDILIELDQSLRIKSIDGATGLLDPQGSADLTRLNLADLAAAAHQNEFAKLAKLNEKKSYRYGPVTLPLGVEPTRRNRFCVFVNKVLGEDRVFVTLSLESRLVRDAFGSDEALMANTTPDAFIDRVKKRLTEQTDDPAGVKLSVIEALNENLTSTAAAAVLRTLAEQSCDGGTAAQLSPGRFAVLHSAAPDAPDTHDLMAQAEVSSGVSLQGMSLGSGNTASVQPEIFLHTLKALVESGESTSFEDIAKSYDSLLQDNVEKAHAFRKIITERKFTLRYQPIVSLKDRTIHHYEALSRFHKDIDFDGPGDAIGFAEQTGLIADYDLAVLKQAFKEIILAKGLKSPVKLAANISGYSLGKASFCDELLKLLKKNVSCCNDLQLEITESFQIADLAGLSEIVKKIQGLGFKMCLDDFGAGASGFQYLRALPVDCVKIDGPYIRDALADPNAKAFLRAMISLCRELGIETVAEWVETEEQHTCLAELQADYGQGFLYGAAGDLPKGGEPTIFRSSR